MVCNCNINQRVWLLFDPTIPPYLILVFKNDSQREVNESNIKDFITSQSFGILCEFTLIYLIYIVLLEFNIMLSNPHSLEYN